MENQPAIGTMRSNPRLLAGAAIFVALAGIVILFAVVNPRTSASGLLPLLATPTTTQDNPEAASAVAVTFTELNSDPVAYLNKPILVSGSYFDLDSPSCPRFSGPAIQWALVSEDLQLDAKGFERVVHILEPGTAMTLQGIWRLYQGPLGCGKGPPIGSAWYIQVQRIIQPNPLVGNGSLSPFDIKGADLGFPDLLPTDAPLLTPTVTQFIETPLASATEPQVGAPATIAPTITIDSGIGMTPTLTPSFATNTPDPGGNTPAPSSTPGASSTTDPGGGETDPTPTPQTPLPPTSTETSGGYPGKPSATPSPDPYLS